MRVVRSLIAGIMIIGAVSSANANLVTNGGFESNEITANSWKWFSSDLVDGWDGSNIEIWNNYDNFAAYEGEQYAELNAHPSNGEGFSIFQEITTVVGEVYKFSFAYAARTSNDEEFAYTVGGALNENVVVTANLENDLVREWTLFETEFTANDTLTNIVFTAVNPVVATVGNFLDDVVVVAKDELSTNEASAPAGIAMFFMSVAGMFYLRRRA
jgi:hypothetical protein